MQLHYQSLGQGQPLLLVHGLFGSANNWGAIAKHFSATHQVFSVDLRNHGRSPHSDSQTYADMVDDLFELCEQVGLENIHLLGHSLGGKVVMCFAEQHPELIHKLIVVDIAMRTYPDKITGLIDAMMAVDLHTMQSRSEVNEALISKISNAKIRQFLLMNLIKSDDHLQWRINLPALKANYPVLRQAVCEHTQYNNPCLFIQGKRSDYVLDSDIEQIKKHFTQAEFTSISTGHWVHAEQPQAFIDVLAAFITKPV